MPNGPLRPHRVGIRITGIHYVELDAVNAQHAEGQALLLTIARCCGRGVRRIEPDSGKIIYHVGEPAKPVEVRLDSVESIRVVDVVEKP